MKVLILTNNVKPDSGWGRYSLGIVDAFKKIPDCKLSVLSEDGQSPETKILSARSFVNIVKNILRVRKSAKSFDIVHCLDCWPYGVYGMFATIFSKRKLFINGVGTYSVIGSKFSYKGLLMYFSYKIANGVFCISNYTKKRILEGVSLNNIETVHMGHNPLPVLSEKEINDNRNKFEIRNEHPIILTTGAIKERKGQFDTLKAVQVLKNQYPNILYCIVGSTDEVAYVNEINKYCIDNDLRNNVRIFPDIKDDKGLAFFYSICDIFALNSNNRGLHFEGFGLVILEANQFGKPAVGSEDCGIEDAVINGLNGYLTKQADIDDIAKAMIKILQNNDLEKTEIQAFSDKFLWSKTVETYVSKYK